MKLFNYYTLPPITKKVIMIYMNKRLAEARIDNPRYHFNDYGIEKPLAVWLWRLHKYGLYSQEIEIELFSYLFGIENEI